MITKDANSTILKRIDCDRDKLDYFWNKLNWLMEEREICCDSPSPCIYTFDPWYPRVIGASELLLTTGTPNYGLPGGVITVHKIPQSSINPSAISLAFSGLCTGNPNLFHFYSIPITDGPFSGDTLIFAFSTNSFRVFTNDLNEIAAKVSCGPSAITPEGDNILTLGGDNDPWEFLVRDCYSVIIGCSIEQNCPWDFDPSITSVDIEFTDYIATGGYQLPEKGIYNFSLIDPSTISSRLDAVFASLVGSSKEDYNYYSYTISNGPLSGYSYIFGFRINNNSTLESVVFTNPAAAAFGFNLVPFIALGSDRCSGGYHTFYMSNAYSIDECNRGARIAGYYFE